MNGAAAATAVAAALCYAFAAAWQHRAARREVTTVTLDPRLLARLLRRPLWLAGGAADLVGAALHGAALALGPLALVQPLLVSGLILAVPLEAALDDRRPSRRDLVGVALAGAGLGTFVVASRPESGALNPRDTDLAPVVLGVGALVALLVLVALRMTGNPRATILGIAAGAGYALAATLAKACIDRFRAESFGLLADWRLYALAVVGLVSILLHQNAFQAGTLAGPLTGIVLTDPLASIFIAVTAYQETLATHGSRPVVEVPALTAMVWGVWLVSTRQSTVSAPRGS